MKAHITEEGPKSTESDIISLERELGASLPPDYRKFLLAHNGGLPTPFVIDIEEFIESPTDVQVFFGIGRKIQSSDLRWNRYTFRDRIGPGFLPIACDSGGSLFCLALSGESRGAIYYVDFAHGKAEVYAVATGIDDMLSKLRE